MVQSSSSSKSNHSQSKLTHTAFKVGPPSKKPNAVSMDKTKKIKQQSMKKYVRKDENVERLRNDPKTENLQLQLKKLKAENDALRKAATAQPTALPAIPRPERGVAGKGFNLRVAMGLEDDYTLYCTVRRCIRNLADRAGLNYAVPWHGQPKETVGKIIGAARERHNFLNKFPHGWPVEEFLKTYLKNKRAYARKQGYLRENINQKQGRNDDDEDGYDELEDEGELENEDHDHEGEDMVVDMQEQVEENGWDRGTGWGADSKGSGSEEEEEDD